MITLSLLLLLAPKPAPVDHPRTYLASIVGVPLRKDDLIESFSIDTWGVTFNAVCRIPYGWRIRAGRAATEDGVLAGDGSQGSTWLTQSSPKELRNFVLLTLYDAVQRNDIRVPYGEIPATFKGRATIATENGERHVRLTYRNVRLLPARHCPAS